MANTRPFRAGDKVRLKTTCSGIETSEICIIKRKDEVLWATGKKYKCCCAFNWQLITPAGHPLSDFRVGMKVVPQKGHTGTIASIGGDRIFVQSGAQCWNFTTNKNKTVLNYDGEPLEIVEEPEATNVVFAPWLLDAYTKMLEISYPTSIPITSPQTVMQKLTTWARKTFSPQQKSLYKAGLIDETLQPTSLGRQELEAILWEEHLEKLVKVADERISEEKDNK